MNSRERVMSALALKDPDQVPFVDWIDDLAKTKLMNALGTQALDEADFATQLNMDACSANIITEFCKPENVLAMVNAKNKYGKYPINLD